VRHFAPSPTVRSSSVPLYMRGFPPVRPLGQVDTIFDPGVVDPMIDTSSMFATDPLLSQGFTQQEADMIDAAAANGVISDAQFQSILSGNHSYEEVSNMIFGTVTPSGPTVAQAALPGQTAAQAAAAAAAALKVGTTALAPGVAPRIAVRPPGVAAPGSVTSMLTQASVLPGVPNFLLIGGGLLLAMAMGGGRR
jgi:hypothetical protein